MIAHPPPPRLRCLLLSALVLPGMLLAQEPTAPSAPSGTSLFGLLQQGGWAMWPLGLLLLCFFYLAFLCWGQTSAGRFLPSGGSAALAKAIRTRDVAAARTTAAQNDTVLNRLLTAALTKARPSHPSLNREAMDHAFVEAAEAEENAISQWINYLNVIATVAPMVGLLGTVSGMIGAFQTIGTGGMGKPEALAGDIGEALITTATGLCIGIPAMIAYFFYRNRLTARMLQVGQEGGVLLDAFEPAEGGANP